jgi:hypothetical protein
MLRTTVTCTVTTAVSALCVGIFAASPAAAESGSLDDPSGDFPDIVRLSYDNAQRKAVMTLRFGESDLAQNVSFYMRWRGGRYQVFYNKPAGTQELRYNDDKVRCRDLVVKELPDKEATRAIVPRSCLSQAPDRLRFQGIATAGLLSSDETDVSPRVARG